MHIFQVSKKMPYPPIDGETIGIYTFTKTFAALQHQVTVLAINTPKHHFLPQNIPAEVQKIAHFDAVFINTNLSVWKAFANLFTSKSYNIQRFIHPHFTQKIIQYLQNNDFDIIELESSYLIPYAPTIRQYTKAPIVVRLQNIETAIWKRLATEEPFFLKRWYLQLLARRMYAFERRISLFCDALLPVSPIDYAFFEKELIQKKPMFLLPFSLNTQLYKPAATPPIRSTSPSAFFLASLDWQPNEQGLWWLLNEVWEQVLQKMPTATLYVAGRHCTPQITEKIKQQYKNVNVVGEVPDAQAFMNEHNIMLVPLFSGSGMRVKIIEGMAMAKAIVATPIAAEGIEYTHNQNILIAETPTDFANAIVELMQNTEKCNEIGEQARVFAEKNHDVVAVTKKLLTFYNQLIINKK